MNNRGRTESVATTRRGFQLYIKMKRCVQSLAWATLACALPVCADWDERLLSPDGSTEVAVMAKGCRLSWRVARKGATLFDDSEIGL